MSKSGLYAHFKSKEELELATIETAAEIFERDVLGSGGRVARGPQSGAGRSARRSSGTWNGGVFPGGCFFASVAAEVDTRPGPVRDRIFEVIEDWVGALMDAVAGAQAAGEIDPAEDAEQLAFEIDAMLLMANAAYVMEPSAEALERGRRGIAKLIGPPPR